MREIFFTISMMFATQVFALPEGSSDRCIDGQWNEKSLLPAPSQYELIPASAPSQYVLSPANYYAEQFKEVSPQEIIQSVVDLMLTFYDSCGVPPASTGSLEESFGIRICEQMALYDMTHDSIFSEISTDKKEESLFVPEDLSFLRSVFKTCRPSMRKAWWYPLIFHVSFEPTEEEYKQFGNALKVL
ncbi:MAG: hypothetical protein ACD_16C00130G0017 [uncultured bacterium]|nr:MAG: hypothetical protein ACD_16C00130G0017 [uncultured bacterium]OFW69593.1 MAG: hypothetical protein A2X70_01095 [Alphaproteobacteria bacterium GWC2_42_16]OFW74117.1 MAG: hypothetical protein A2Z80_04760 [Alphaproteobacteria bacterium GWA2_41_27]OFW84425.1 MAG: hypothetical protein A3E50_03445 [Alphaproteobacteria bacterium RIFCSPHIGHO2_12_FULL_42_100]OFW85946.1 MAG: hypothetical protein A2W06_05325 [Alphaproteobacteria bacterium RBG_16_42_14]OFW92272.1 MAG: hypothetical protein A3C41_030